MNIFQIQDTPMNSTVDGIRIDVNPQRPNAQCSIRFKLQPLSKATSFRDLHKQQQYAPITSTDFGIKIWDEDPTL
jgi:hypothetical protein